ncbi:MAG: hypothetical protein JWL96_4673, partial [Sphingomonas bacterium]|uniref:hypothetical protein n=1 Tax=Sphingomonas bacterium TaxID=1895847 RepID=UPI002623BACD
GKAHVAERIDFRHRKSRAVAATLPVLSPPPSLPLPPQPPPQLPPPQAIELALRGLHNMGFSRSDERRAVDHVSKCRVENGDELDVQDLLRGAIAALT